MGKIGQTLLDQAAKKSMWWAMCKQPDFKSFWNNMQVAKLQEWEWGRESLERVKGLKGVCSLSPDFHCRMDDN